MPEERTEDNPSPQEPSEKELFFAALEIKDPEERSAWLQEACGEDGGGCGASVISWRPK